MAKFGYARVSTGEQNLDLQLDALRAAGFEEILTEEASGTREDRPVLNRLLARLKPGDVLGVWKLDRLGRNARHLIFLMADLGNRRIDFRSIMDNVDTTTAMGKFMFHIFSSLAQFERDQLVERTVAGVAAARKRGRVGGNPGLKKHDPEAIRRTREGRIRSHRQRLSDQAELWLPLVTSLRLPSDPNTPPSTWEAIAASLNALPGVPAGRWTTGRLVRSVRHLVAAGQANERLLDRAPRPPAKVTREMTRVDQMLATDPFISLSEIARQLEKAGARTPRMSATWSITAVKTLLRNGRKARPAPTGELVRLIRAPVTDENGNPIGT